LQTRVSRNANEEIQERLGVLQRIADWLAWFSGSMPFLLSHTVWFAIWISLNTVILPKNADGTRGFDPFPFGLLTMIVSLEAIFLACFVLISQNRQAEKDKVKADIEYEVNIKAELEVAHLHEKTDRIQETMLARFNRLEGALGQLASAATINNGSGDGARQ
jgi:CRP/FNR family cyclic AMP-dependent transcriptional regulator